jgi:hypothetical protein
MSAFHHITALARAAAYAGRLLVAASIVPCSVPHKQTSHATTSGGRLGGPPDFTTLLSPPASHDLMHYHTLSFLSSWPGCRCDHGCSQQGFCRAAQDTDHATARGRRFEESRMTRMSCLRGKDRKPVTLSPSERASSAMQLPTRSKELILWFDCRLVWSYRTRVVHKYATSSTSTTTTTARACNRRGQSCECKICALRLNGDCRAAAAVGSL